MSITRTFIIVLLGFFWTLSEGSLFAQNVWETLPVFHGGRVMPLHTFAQQTVREICGSTHPYVIWDDAVIAEFKQVIEAMRRQTAIEEDESSARFRFLSRNNDLLDGGFKREYSVFEVEQELPPVQTVLPIRGLNRTRIEEIASRIRQLVPPEGRYFSADEILLSWIIEPEVWTYIPIFPVPELDYLDEMFDISFQNDARTSLYCVSLYQLENSPRYKQRCADIQRRKELGQITKNPIPFDQITERLENQVRLFRELTFHPHRQRPERMLSLLYQVAGMAQGQSSYASACDAWGYLLALGEAPGRQSTERPSSSNEPAILHPTTQRWHDVADIFHLLIRAYRQSDSRGNAVFPNPLMIEEQYETLIKLIDINLAESVALMESIYPEVSYQMDEHVPNIDVKKLLPLLESSGQSQNQVTVRRVVISYYYSVKKLRNEIEAAYLALYDNGLALRFMPMRSSLSLATNGSEDDFGVQPWASAQMILGSGETFVKRFFDPQVNAVSVMPIISGENQTIDISGDNVQTEDSEASSDEMENAGNVDTDVDSKEASPSKKPSPNPSNEIEERTNEELLFLPFTMESGILPMSSSSQSSGIGSVRNDLRLLLVSYSSSGGAYGASDFLVRVQQFQNAVRQTAVRIEAYRESLTEEGNEHFIKTTYPLVTGKLLAEYRYDRLNPFYWMWFFALIAVILNVGSYLAAFARSKTAVARTILIHSVKKTGKNEETELQDYTNTVEEGLFVASVFMLVLSIVVAFIGGAMRAAVTGWAPITNMYETVVMMAFSTAVLGLWYALHPILHPALQLAWIYAKFPGVSTLLEWIAAKKERQSTQLLRHETAGEIAMREAAEDFGVPGGASPGGRNPMLLLTSAEIEAQQRVRIAQRKIAGQCLTAAPRLIFSVATFYFIVLLANGEYAAQHGFLAAACNMFTATDFIDLFVVIASILLLVWFVPHILLMLIITPIVLSRPSWMAAETGIRSFEATMIVEGAEHHPTKPHQSHTAGLVHSEMSGVFHGETHSSEPKDTSGIAWLKQSRNAALNRKMFIAITAIIVFIAGLTASLNRVEFNPDIRPIAAVLRSNFWLTVHVIAIVVSYAAAFIAWGMAVFSLGCVIFGRYQRETIKGQTSVQLPKTCQMFLPVIERLLRIALLLLVIGTVLGARWADYSWGRFWSWDPKEVWALITILFYTIVFHGRVARYYGTIGITVGALFASIAVIITWYGINFVFKGSVHAYGGGAENNAAIFLGTFIAMNVLWGALALLRYSAEVYGNEAAEHIKPIEGGM